MSSLLLIDLQQDFLSPTRIPAKPFIDSLPPLLRQFTTRRRPIVWIDSAYEQGKGTYEEDVSSKNPPQSNFELFRNSPFRPFLCPQDSRHKYPQRPSSLSPCTSHTYNKDPLLRIDEDSTPRHSPTNKHKTHLPRGSHNKRMHRCHCRRCLQIGLRGHIVEDGVKAFKQHRHDRAILTLTEKPYDVNLYTSNNVSSYLSDDKQLQPLPVLLWVKGSIPSWRVMITLAWKKIPYLSKRLRVMIKPKETRSPEFALINSRCKTPTYVDSGGTIVIESMAILQYLERFFPGIPENRPSDLSKSEWTQETVRFYESENPHRIYEPTELLYDAEWEKHRENIRQAYYDVFKEFEHWDRYLTNGGFLSARHAFGLADCAFSPVLAYMVHRGLALTSKFSGLENYHERCGALQPVLEACPDHWERPGKSLFLRCEKMLKECDSCAGRYGRNHSLGDVGF